MNAPDTLTPPSDATAGIEAVTGLLKGYREAKILFTAAKLELFNLLDRCPLGRDEICGELGTKPGPTGTLLDALTAMGFLTKQGEAYSLRMPQCRTLVKGSPFYLGSVLKFQDHLWGAWGDLEQVLREGSPQTSLTQRMEKHPDFLREYITSMNNISRQPAAEVAAALDLTGVRDVLDIGGGPGAYSLALLRRSDDIRTEILDLPETLEIAEELLCRNHRRSRMRLSGQDYREMKIGLCEYDMILLSHVTHNESEAINRRLIEKCHSALRPGGQLVIHDFMTVPDNTAPLFSCLFSVFVGIYTDGGRTYRELDYRRWLDAAGFHELRSQGIAEDSTNPSRILVGFKKLF